MRADAVSAHRTHAVRDDQPAGLCFHRRAAVADLYGFPFFARFAEQLGIAPEMGMIGEHEEEVLIVLPGDHGVAPMDAAGKQCHPLVLHGAPIERERAKMQEIRGLEQLRQNGAAVIGGVSGVIEDAAIVLDETDEARVFHAVALVRGDGEYDALGDAGRGIEMDFVIGLGQPAHAFHGPLDLPRQRAGFLRGPAHGGFQFAEGKGCRRAISSPRWTNRSRSPSPSAYGERSSCDKSDWDSTRAR